MKIVTLLTALLFNTVSLADGRTTSFYNIYQDESGYRWNLQERNGEVIAHSGESFGTYDAVRRSISTIIWQAAGSQAVLDESPSDYDHGYRFEYFQGRDQQWYWRFRSGNHRTLAVGEGYASAFNVIRAIENVRWEMGRAEVRDLQTH